MPAVFRLDKKGLNDLIDNIKARGGDPGEFEKLLNEINEDERRGAASSIPAINIADEEYLEEMRSKSSIEHGTGLECMMCRGKFDHLICGVCEVCFRGWMLPLKPKGRTKKLL